MCVQPSTIGVNWLTAIFHSFIIMLQVLEEQLNSEREVSKAALRDKSGLTAEVAALQRALQDARAAAAAAAASLQQQSDSAQAEKALELAHREKEQVVLKQLSELKKKLLLVQGQMGLEVDHWKEVASLAKTKNDELAQNVQDTRQHYESVVATLRGQLEQSKSRDSEVSKETAALNSDLKTANTLLAMQRNKREDMQREIDALRKAKTRAEEEVGCTVGL